jgi:hypothetical protein
VNRFVILIGLLAAMVPLLLLAYDLYGVRWVSENVVAKWNGMDAKTQMLAGGGAAVLVAFVIAVICIRMAGGVRGAIREYLDTAPAV